MSNNETTTQQNETAPVTQPPRRSGDHLGGDPLGDPLADPLQQNARGVLGGSKKGEKEETGGVLKAFRALNIKENIYQAWLDRPGRRSGIIEEAAEIPDQDIVYEQLAHGIYGNIPEKVIAGWGYEKVAEIDDAPSGFFGRTYAPRADLQPEERIALEAAHGRPLAPVVVLRGTEGAPDVLDDLNLSGVGQWQYNRNVGNIQGLLSAGGGKCDVTGHSLGGALAQLVGAHQSGSVGRIVTFQAPAIDAVSAEKLKAHNAEADDEDKVMSTHYVATGDVVSMVGEQKTEGDIYSIDKVGLGNIMDHTDRLLSNVAAARGTDLESIRQNKGAEIRDRIIDIDKIHTSEEDNGSFFEAGRKFLGGLFKTSKKNAVSSRQWKEVQAMAESGLYSLGRIESVIDTMDIDEATKGQFKANLRTTYSELQ